MDPENLINNRILSIIDDFFNTVNVRDPVMPSYYIVQNIATEYLILNPNISNPDSSFVKSLNEYNGLMVPPEEINGTFIVLINQDRLIQNIHKINMTWVGTIIHETTHVQDFVQYAQIINAKKYTEITQNNKHNMFSLWTEIHARSTGYYFTRKYSLGKNNANCEEMLPYIINQELPAQWNYLQEQYDNAVTGYHQAYFVAQYIGRLYTLQKLYPETLNDQWIKKHFGINEWMTNWFLFYKKYPVLENAAQHFDEMKNILQQNFYGL